MSFTPGPWAVQKDNSDKRRVITLSLSGIAICGFVRSSRDAHLIAAAPDMLEELEQQADGSATIAALLKGHQSAVAASLIGMLNIQEQAARAMIAKARGKA